MRGSNLTAGFTYVEVLIAVVILALSAASASYALVNTRRTSVDAEWFDTAQYLVQDGRVWAQILDRIEPTQLVAIGPESGEDRDSFDDLDDLSGFTEWPVVDRTSASFSDYRRTFVVESVDVASPATLVAPGTGSLIRLTIVVARGGNEMAREAFLFWRKAGP